mmetsp:Transcript_43033/g.98949  ORF Transcript_43033/g.98949 Transcript_43033/m.98949 type:complete len:590 (+) Transcript_43033:108-1877(+)
MVFNPVTKLLFPTPTPSYDVNSFAGNLLWVPRSLNPQTAAPEDCIPLLLFKSTLGSILVIYFHSNAEDLGRCYEFCSSMCKQLQVHVLVVEYPSYGICPGSHCDEQLATDSAFTALRFAREVLRWPLERIILFGRSIGTGPAISLATQLEALGGLVLVCPFISIKEVCKEVLWPVSYMINERFPNLERVTQVRCPCLIVHGQKDSLIPLRHGKLLYDACQSRKRLVMPANMDHNDSLLNDPRWFIKPLADFFVLHSKGVQAMEVPKWVFDKRFCPQYLREVGTQSNSFAATCSVCSTERPARKSSTRQEALDAAQAKRAYKPSPHAEEIIANAVEGALASKEVQFWAEMERTLEMDKLEGEKQKLLTKSGALHPSDPPTVVVHAQHKSRRHAPKTQSTALLPVLGDISSSRFAVHVTTQRVHRKNPAEDSNSEPDFDFVVVSDLQELEQLDSEARLGREKEASQPPKPLRPGSRQGLQRACERASSFEFDLDNDEDSVTAEHHAKPEYEPHLAQLAGGTGGQWQRSDENIVPTVAQLVPKPKARASKGPEKPHKQSPQVALQPMPIDAFPIDGETLDDMPYEDGKYLIV